MAKRKRKGTKQDEGASADLFEQAPAPTRGEITEADLEPDPRLMAHKVYGPLIAAELERDPPRAGYLRGISNAIEDAELKAALRRLALAIADTYGYSRNSA